MNKGALIKGFLPDARLAQKAILLFVFWGLIFYLSIVTAAFLFGTNKITFPALSYAFFSFSLIVFNHYTFLIFGSRLINKKRWTFLLSLLVLLYLFSHLSILPLEVLEKYYPEFDKIRIQRENYTIHSFLDILLLNTFPWVFTVVLTPNIIAALFYLSKNNYESRRRNALLQKENAELELNFLRAQIHPHFLFNTLNNIYGLVMDNEKAAQVVLKLSDLLRFSLYESNGGLIPLKREIEFLINYISLEQIRHAGRVSIQYCFKDINDPEASIAPLLLINFVENAFKHGINATRHQAWVNISLKQEKDTITFTVENSKSAKAMPGAKTAGGGVGMENVKRRFALQYPGRHRLKIHETTETYKVSLTLHTNE